MSYDPSHHIIESESNHLFECYCTFVNTLKGKKLSVQNVFVATLDDIKLQNILKMILNLETDQELVRVFINYDPGVSTSKHVTRAINSKKKK